MSPSRIRTRTAVQSPTVRLGANSAKISPRPVRERRDANPGRGNVPGNTIDRIAGNTGERYGRRVHPRVKLPDRVVLWALRLLRSSHPPQHQRRCSREEALSGWARLRQLCPRRYTQYTPAVGSWCHISHRTAAGGDVRSKLRRFVLGFRSWILTGQLTSRRRFVR